MENVPPLGEGNMSRCHLGVKICKEENVKEKEKRQQIKEKFKVKG
jgi:hypothetical protein